MERERAGNEVVRADREEVGLERDLRCATRSLRRLDHRSELDRMLLAERVPEQRPHEADLLRRVDERQQDSQARSRCPSGRSRAAAPRAPPAAQASGQAHAPGPVEERRRLVRSEVERAHRRDAAAKRGKRAARALLGAAARWAKPARRGRRAPCAGGRHRPPRRRARPRSPRREAALQRSVTRRPSSVSAGRPRRTRARGAGGRPRARTRAPRRARCEPDRPR